MTNEKTEGNVSDKLGGPQQDYEEPVLEGPVSWDEAFPDDKRAPSMELLKAIKESLTKIEGALFEEGRRKATKKINDAFEKLAFIYADGAGFAFGMHDNSHSSSQNKDSAQRILVFREEGQKHNDRDVQGRFLFDHCWLVYYNAKASSDNAGRLAGCELIMESEWDFVGDNSHCEFKFLQDFRKLVVAGARTKVFIFQSNSKESRESTFCNLQAEIKSFGNSVSPGSTYLLCGWIPKCFKYVTVPG